MHANSVFRLAGTVLAITMLIGCQSTSFNMSRLNPWRADDDLTNTDDVAGPLQRILNASHNQPDDGSLGPEEGRAEYEEAIVLFENGDFGAAQKRFKGLAKKYKHTPVGEDAQFMVAECAFHKKRYSWAQDHYDELMKEYPSTRHLDTATRRHFAIAQHWLPELTNVSTSEIQQVNFEKPQSTPKPERQGPSWTQPTRKIPILPNFVDRSRPVFDTEGRALQSLRSIWLNDPTGPLADDALMLTASYYLRKGDYEEADRVFTMLRREYPKSPHLENAFILGSHVKMMSYQGPAYDGDVLHGAGELKQSVVRLFPDADQQRHKDELRRIEESKAQREWEMVEYWEKKGKPESVAVYCREVIRLYPSTTYADRARQKLHQLQAGPPQRGFKLPEWNLFQQKTDPVPAAESPDIGRSRL